jgi:hypothetical protein
VLSNSWGSNGFSQSLLAEIDKTNANEMLFVAAAGNLGANNDGSPFYPANHSTAVPNVISVAATDSGDNLAGFSDYGLNSVQLAAPGVGIYSTVPGGGYAALDGTSMAAPHVAGAAMLVLAACPSYSTAALKNALLSNVDPVASLSGKTVTGGRLNVNKAVRSCSVASGPLKATFLGTTGEDFAGIGTVLQPNGVVDWHIKLEGLRATPLRTRVTSADGGLWEGPFNGASYLVATQYAGNGGGDAWIEPWASSGGLHVKVWYPDSTTDDIDVTVPTVIPSLRGTYLGSTGQDFLDGLTLLPNGIPDWHIQLQGLRGAPLHVQVTGNGDGLWESPFNGTNWVVAIQYSGNGNGDIWLEPWSLHTAFHLKVWYSDGTMDEANVVLPTSSMTASFLGVTGEDNVGQDASPGANGVPDWHIRLQGLRGVPVAVRITSSSGLWEAPLTAQTIW